MKALTGTVAVSGTILFIILGATTFSQVLSFSGATNGIVALVSGQGLSATAIIIGMMLILLFLGCFVDQVEHDAHHAAVLHAAGAAPRRRSDLVRRAVSDLHAAGLLTPPFGLLLFTMKGVAPPGITMQQIYAASVPYIVFGLIVLVAIFLFPPIATWLPGVLGN
jgi:TRAP-type mannitol/chloroaromatic compound transport system permease large subunit